MNREEAIQKAERALNDPIAKGGGVALLELDHLRLLLEALRGPQPDPITGLVPCGWCGPERIGWFSVQFWVRASTGKRKWMSVTQQYKKQVNYCPMCGRKLEVESNEN